MPRTLAASALLGLFLGSAIAHLLAPPHWQSLLDRIRQGGVLRVIALEGPVTYFAAWWGPAGVEYEIARRFAEALGVEIAWSSSRNIPAVIEALAGGKAHLAVGLAITEGARKRARFTPPYRRVRARIIYRRGQRRPRRPGDLAEKVIEVMQASPFSERLRALQRRHPELTWKESGSPLEELLMLTWEGIIDHTAADEEAFAHLRLFYPELSPALELPPPLGFAFAFPKSEDASLYGAASAFLKRFRRSGGIKRLLDFYNGYVRRFDYVDTRTLIRRILLRLPRWRPHFQEAARKYGLDWRLLAAMAYQESHWNPKARSKTGVRGMMMLTRDTAAMLDIDDHLDPVKSIFGGARYFAWLKEKVPQRIPEPDRTFMALAAYNIGFGHLEDARILTQRQGGDPDAWVDVKRRLPLLAKRPFFEKTRHGYARGYEAVDYVEKIRRYHDILVHFTQEPLPLPPPRALRILPEAL
ncbi:MAG: membrane-bound lytic murein transglycosylase MltF [Gammaproteobacteria bacterium]|nr:MAG: membrane-bound lytic murein transglycosylase MltF [Gammaproteobacteria bacterium]